MIVATIAVVFGVVWGIEAWLAARHRVGFDLRRLEEEKRRRGK